MPLKATSFFLMKTRAMMEVTQQERTDRVAQKDLLKYTAPWERLHSQKFAGMENVTLLTFWGCIMFYSLVIPTPLPRHS